LPVQRNDRTVLPAPHATPTSISLPATLPQACAEPPRPAPFLVRAPGELAKHAGQFSHWASAAGHPFARMKPGACSRAGAVAASFVAHYCSPVGTVGRPRMPPIVSLPVDLPVATPPPHARLDGGPIPPQFLLAQCEPPST